MFIAKTNKTPSQKLDHPSLTGFRGGGTSFEKVGWTIGKIDCQKVYLTFFISFLLRNKCRPEESGVDMSTPVHPVAAGRRQEVLHLLVKEINLFLIFQTERWKNIQFRRYFVGKRVELPNQPQKERLEEKHGNKFWIDKHFEMLVLLKMFMSLSHDEKRLKRPVWKGT